MKIALLIPYFGEFPEWSEIYFYTLRRNPEINFIFYTDQDGSAYESENIHFNKIPYSDYLDIVREKLNINFQPSDPYKLCDLRPCFGELHAEDFDGYDFYGWTDMDILFGHIRSFYTDEILEKFDVISTHGIRISGHLALFRNTGKNRTMYRNIYRWKYYLEKPEFIGIDEHGITNAFTMTWFDKWNEKTGMNVKNWFSLYLKYLKMRRLYLKEQYTTPFTSIPWLDGSTNSDHPDTWFYRDGSITNQRDGNRKFIYLHLMNFKNRQWRHDGTSAPWENVEQICHAGVENMKNGIRIDPSGIFPLN